MPVIEGKFEDLVTRYELEQFWTHNLTDKAVFLQIVYFYKGSNCNTDWSTGTYHYHVLQVFYGLFIIKQEGQCRYNVTFRHVRESLLPWNSNKYNLLVCVCMRVCMRVRVCEYPGACALLMQIASVFNIL